MEVELEVMGNERIRMGIGIKVMGIAYRVKDADRERFSVTPSGPFLMCCFLVGLRALWSSERTCGRNIRG